MTFANAERRGARPWSYRRAQSLPSTAPLPDAVHDAIARRDDLLWSLASDVLERFCQIRGGSDSILFGPEKDGRIPVLESIKNALTDDSQLYVGNRGRPPKLKRHIGTIMRAFRRPDDRANLPRGMRGVWKADLFLGNHQALNRVGTTVKINRRTLEGAQGLRIGIYPKADPADVPRKDPELILARLPLPYDAHFMELFYKSFSWVRAFLDADAHVPAEERLPDAEDRFVTKELESRRKYPILKVVEAIRTMSQTDLLEPGEVTELRPIASLSEGKGLAEMPAAGADGDFISLSPVAEKRPSTLR